MSFSRMISSIDWGMSAASLSVVWGFPCSDELAISGVGVANLRDLKNRVFGVPLVGDEHFARGVGNH